MEQEIGLLKDAIERGEVDLTIQKIDELLSTPNIETKKDYLYYLRGNAYRKKSNWKEALDSYQCAIDLNPQSPAVQARQAALEILEFFHKDMYNQ